MTNHTPGDKIPYLRSFASELLAQANRVRNLIGSRHWLSDGRHKERILTTILRKHLPSAVSLSSGFVLSPTDMNRCSTEQDILIVDTTYSAPILNEDHLVISFPGAVRTAISVKSTLGQRELHEAIKGLASVRSIANESRQHDLFCAAYFFDPDPSLSHATLLDHVETSIRASAPATLSGLPSTDPVIFAPDMLLTSTDFVIRFNYFREDNPARHCCTIRSFKCDGLASALLLAELLTHIATSRGQTNSELTAFIDIPIFEQDSPSRTFRLDP